jgi:hypothetical protein
MGMLYLLALISALEVTEAINWSVLLLQLLLSIKSIAGAKVILLRGLEI